MAKKMLQMFQTCDKKQFANIVTGDENWVYYFEPVRKFSNKIWASKHSRRPIIAKRSLSARKVWYAIFFSVEGVAIKVPMENGKKISVKHYKDIVLEKPKIIIRNDALSLVLNISVFYMAMSLLLPQIVSAFWKKENVIVLPHLPYSLDLALCEFFMFPKLK